MIKFIKIKEKSYVIIFIWFIALLLSIILSLLVGSTGFLWDTQNQLEWTIFYKVRLPRTLLAIIAGAGLVVSGQIYQTILNNPLADSFTLGLASGATFGSALAVFLGASIFIVPIFSIVFSLVTLCVVLIFTEMMAKTFHVATMILTGIFVGAFFNAALYILLILKPNKMNSMVSYMFGSISSAEFDTVKITGIVTIVCITLILILSKWIKLMQLGEEKAMSVGVNVRLISWISLIIAAIMTAVIVSFTGIIGFIGLVGPQVIRRVYHAPLQFQILLNILIGSTFLLIADIAGRIIISPVQVPVGIVLSIVAIPIMMYLMITERKLKSR